MRKIYYQKKKNARLNLESLSENSLKLCPQAEFVCIF